LSEDQETAIIEDAEDAWFIYLLLHCNWPYTVLCCIQSSYSIQMVFDL